MKVAPAKLMTQGPLLPSIISYTIPIIVTSILQLLFNAADLVVVGRFCGSISVAAVGATGSLTNLIVNLFIGLSVGAGVSVAHALGSRENETVHRTIHTALPLALISGVILTVVGILLSEKLLIMMETPDTVLPLSTVYMQIYFGGMTFNMVYNFCAAILRAAGDTKSPLILLGIAGVLNVVLNVIFVTLFHMNVAGVALATAISQAVSAILVVFTLIRRMDVCRLRLNKLRIYKEPLLKILRIGLPSGLQSSLFAISNVLIQSSLNSFGDIAMSGCAAAGNIEGFVYVTQNAFHQTTVNFVGQNCGAKQYKRVFKIVWLCTGCVAVAGMIVSALAYGFAPALLSIYITDSQEAIAYGVTRMAYVCLPYFLCGIMEVSTGALRGIGSSVVPMLLSVIGVCGFRIGWIMTVFQIPAYHSLESLYFSYPLSWTVTLLMQFAAFVIVFRKRLKQEQQAGLLPESAAEA